MKIGKVRPVPKGAGLSFIVAADEASNAFFAAAAVTLNLVQGPAG
jgi:hypothetical protein